MGSNALAFEQNQNHSSEEFKCNEGFKACNTKSAYKSYKTCVNATENCPITDVIFIKKQERAKFEN